MDDKRLIDVFDRLQGMPDCLREQTLATYQLFADDILGMRDMCLELKDDFDRLKTMVNELQDKVDNSIKQ